LKYHISGKKQYFDPEGKCGDPDISRDRSQRSLLTGAGPDVPVLWDTLEREREREREKASETRYQTACKKRTKVSIPHDFFAQIMYDLFTGFSSYKPEFGYIPNIHLDRWIPGTYGDP
jgi:hypothetical protein